MADLLAMSADIIDGRVAPTELGPLNRINHQLSELSNDLAVVCLLYTSPSPRDRG